MICLCLNRAVELLCGIRLEEPPAGGDEGLHALRRVYFHVGLLHAEKGRDDFLEFRSDCVVELCGCVDCESETDLAFGNDHDFSRVGPAGAGNPRGLRGAEHAEGALGAGRRVARGEEPYALVAELVDDEDAAAAHVEGQGHVTGVAVFQGRARHGGIWGRGRGGCEEDCRCALRRGQNAVRAAEGNGIRVVDAGPRGELTEEKLFVGQHVLVCVWQVLEGALSEDDLVCVAEAAKDEVRPLVGVRVLRARAVLAVGAESAPQIVGVVRGGVRAVVPGRQVGPVGAETDEELGVDEDVLWPVNVCGRVVLVHLVARAAPDELGLVDVALWDAGAVRAGLEGHAAELGRGGRGRGEGVVEVEDTGVVDAEVVVVADPGAVGGVGARARVVGVLGQVGARGLAEAARGAHEPAAVQVGGFRVAPLAELERAREDVEVVEADPGPVAAERVGDPRADPAVAGLSVACEKVQACLPCGDRDLPERLQVLRAWRGRSRGEGFCGGGWGCGGCGRGGSDEFCGSCREGRNFCGGGTRLQVINSVHVVHEEACSV